ncbi:MULTISPECIES: hypothetical protein [unclassified Isoptericola]|uniref:hypothetical protein n=1 Tax=unclassified Isoptericola TaxID=2623355 RepID=UPI0036507C90
MTDRTTRVLVVGRSARALTEVVALLRAQGYPANATNQFDRVLDDYDPADVDLVIFGGFVPPALREHLEAELGRRHPGIRCVGGLGGVAPLLVAQVEELTRGAALGVRHDEAEHAVRVTTTEPAHVTVTVLWGVPVPPDPIPHVVAVADDDLPAGAHAFALPADTPAHGAFARVQIGDRVSVLRLGPAPRPAPGANGPGAAALPDPAPVTTRLPWHLSVGATPF